MTEKSPKSNFSTIAISVVLVLSAILSTVYAAYVVFYSADKQVAAISMKQHIFTLVSHNGDIVTAETFTGKPSALFFGYTHCPEVCPTTLMDMTDVIEELGDKADGARFTFVSIDPERDTQEMLAEYMTSFSPQILGVTGTPVEIAKLAEGLKVFYRKTGEGEEYDMDHMSWIYLFDSNGDFVRTASFKNPNEKLADIMQELMH